MKKTVFLGDSITEGYGVSLRERWNDGMPERTVNRGISGDTTAGMLRRFSAHVLAEHPERVVLMGGLNDLGSRKEWKYVAENIRSMCEWAQRERIEPILSTCVEPDYDAFLVSDWADYLPGIRQISDQLQRLNEWIRGYARDSALLCIDFAAEFPKRLTSEYCRYFMDGEHPNRFGHAVMREIACAVLYPAATCK